MEKNFIGAMNFVAVNKTVENYKKSIERLNKQKQK